MKINIYNEEITGEVEVVEKTAHDTGITYHGVRMFLASSEQLHDPETGDDDRSVVTFWTSDARVALRLAGLLRTGLLVFSPPSDPEGESSD